MGIQTPVESLEQGNNLIVELKSKWPALQAICYDNSVFIPGPIANRDVVVQFIKKYLGS